MSGPGALQRREVLYRGRVQGVGFRYTTEHVAAGHDVTGFVQNLPDGRVRLVAEGDRDELQRFLADVRSALEGYITDSNESTAPATGEFKRFSIRQ